MAQEIVRNPLLTHDSAKLAFTRSVMVSVWSRNYDDDIDIIYRYLLHVASYDHQSVMHSHARELLPCMAYAQPSINNNMRPQRSQNEISRALAGDLISRSQNEISRALLRETLSLDLEVKC